MTDKTHKTAVVLIPPEGLWEPIQSIRRQHDRQIRRWMPHLTLLYPFRPAREFDAVAPALIEACRAVQPFEVELGEFGFFAHGTRSLTFYVRPQPAREVVALQEALVKAVPDCDDTSRFADGFQPHLSLGQCRRKGTLLRLLEDLGQTWSPIRFPVEQVFFIQRGDPPNDVFVVDRAMPLGR